VVAVLAVQCPYLLVISNQDMNLAVVAPEALEDTANHTAQGLSRRL
jgi:hypothetical protein